MSSKVIQYRFDRRPLIEVVLENLHDKTVAPIQFTALIDTGAAKTVIPYSVCKVLGHIFEKGTTSSNVSGVGAGTVRTFLHATRLTVLNPVSNDRIVKADNRAFDPIEISLEFIEQKLPFILLGQRDFLRMFKYCQDGNAGWFSLEKIG
jgi:hypothetical protein